MDVEYGKYYYTGWPKDVLTGLKISIALYLKNYRHVKIGITGDLKTRCRAHGNPNRSIKWQRMVVKYQTDSIENANIIEKFFIRNEPKLDNIYEGKSNMTKTGPYYVYILLSGKRRK